MRGLNANNDCRQVLKLKAALNEAIAECRSRGFDGPQLQQWIELSSDAGSCNKVTWTKISHKSEVEYA